MLYASLTTTGMIRHSCMRSIPWLIGVASSNSFTPIQSNYKIDAHKSHKTQKPHLWKGSGREIRKRTCIETATWILEAPTSRSINVIVSNLFVHLVVIPNPSMDLQVYLFHPSYSIHIIIMIMFCLHVWVVPLFLERWSNLSTTMNWNKDYVCFY
jgi:hypothetical protein